MKQQKLLSLIRQAIQDYNMIEEGDRIAVGVSGGKDSLTLLYAMKLLQGFYPKRFELSAITCNVGFEGMDFTGVAEYCKHLEIPVFGCEVRWRNLSSRVFDFDSNFWICFDHVRDSTWTNDKKKSCRSISDFR